MTLNPWSLWGRATAVIGAGLMCASLAAAQYIPPEPPGAGDPSATEREPGRDDTLRDSDNSPRRATEPPSTGRDIPSDRPQPRSTFDDSDAFRDATRRSEAEIPKAPRDTAREAEPYSDPATRFVPDPRPGGMSEPQASGDFDVTRVRSPDIGLWFDRSTADGLVINDIGSGAISRLGFREGDRIYSVNNVRVDSEAAFVRTLFDPRWRNQRANVIIYRHGRPWTVYVQPTALVQEYTTVEVDPLDDWGLVLDDRYDDHVVVWRVRPRSPAFYAGLRAGDVITSWQGRRLMGRDEFVRLAGQGRLSDVALDINRNRQLRRIDLDLSSLGARVGGQTSLRPVFDAGVGASASVPRTVVPSRAGAAADVELAPGVAGPAPSSVELDGNLRTGSRFEGTIDGRLEVSPDGRLDRTSNRGLFPSNAPSGTPTPNTGVRGTVEVPGAPGPVRVQGTTRGGIFRGVRP